MSATPVVYYFLFFNILLWNHVLKTALIAKYEQVFTWGIHLSVKKYIQIYFSRLLKDYIIVNNF